MLRKWFSFLLPFTLTISLVLLNKGIKCNYNTFRCAVSLICSFMSLVVASVAVKRKMSECYVFTVAVSLFVSLVDYVLLYFFLESLRIHSIAFVMCAVLFFFIATFVMHRSTRVVAVVTTLLLLNVLSLFERFEINGVEIENDSLDRLFLKPHLSFLIPVTIASAFRMLFSFHFYRYADGMALNPFLHTVFLCLYSFMDSIINYRELLSIFDGHHQHIMLIISGSVLLSPFLFFDIYSRRLIERSTFFITSTICTSIICIFYVLPTFDPLFSKNRLEMISSWFYACLIHTFSVSLLALLYIFKNRMPVMLNITDTGIAMVDL